LEITQIKKIDSEAETRKELEALGWDHFIHLKPLLFWKKNCLVTSVFFVFPVSSVLCLAFSSFFFLEWTQYPLKLLWKKKHIYIRS
jgi:hypothetical protein